MNATRVRNRFLKESEYSSMRLNLAQATSQKHILKNFRRHMEALKKQQLGIMTEYDELVIDSVELSM